MAQCALVALFLTVDILENRRSIGGKRVRVGTTRASFPPGESKTPHNSGDSQNSILCAQEISVHLCPYRTDQVSKIVGATFASTWISNSDGGRFDFKNPVCGSQNSPFPDPRIERGWPEPLLLASQTPPPQRQYISNSTIRWKIRPTNYASH